MNDDQLLRYSRHILLPQIGIEGQARILAARVLVIGAGGLGCPAALYLAAAGVGELTICDDDVVDLSNLQRQILHNSASLGRAKVVSAGEALERINPAVKLNLLQQRLEGVQLFEQVALADVVLDCSDNFVTRHALNLACLSAKKPLVSGAAIRFDGQVSVYDFRQPAQPCYNCLFPQAEDAEELRCAVTGVFAPLTGIVGAMQAAEALKLIGGFGQVLQSRLLLLDALNMTWRSVAFGADPACEVCAQP